MGNKVEEISTGLFATNPIDLVGRTNLEVDELFLEARDISSVVSNLAGIFL